MPVVQSPSSAQKGCICHVILNERERLFPNIADICVCVCVYIYIYIYMKIDKGKHVRKEVKHVRKVVKHVGKVVKHVRKVVKPHENTSHPFSEIVFAILKILY